MTDMNRASAQADLAFLRELVDEGDWRRSARFFGATYVAIGAAIFAQCLALPVLFWLGAGSGLVILVAIVGVWTAYSIAQMVINTKLHHGKFGASLRARAGAAGFLGMVLSHLTLLAVFLITAIIQGDALFMQLAALSFSALQGGLWLMIHTLRRERWQLVVALGWLAAAIAAAPFLGTPAFGLAVAVIAVVLMIAPGIYILIQSSDPD